MTRTYLSGLFFLTPIVLQAADPDDRRSTTYPGYRSAIVVPETAKLLYSAQFAAPPQKGDDIAAEVDRLIEQFRRLFVAFRSAPQATVRLNVYAVDAEALNTTLRVFREKRFAVRAPVVTPVIGAIPFPGRRVAIDVIAIAPTNAVPRTIPADETWKDCVLGPNLGHILPPGPKAFISGQAEKGATPEEAARKTLESLSATTRWLNSTDAQVAHVKSFLTPMTASTELTKTFERHFGAGKTPPMTFVEWKSTLPIEIEMVLSVPAERDAPLIEFLTPPGMTTPAIYSRVTRTARTRLVFTEGYVGSAGDVATQVNEIFRKLADELKPFNSDLKHLVKATYYVSDEDCSKKLNELRPNFYDPKRPPAASKAMVPGTGVEKRGIVVDMIAVPAK